MNSKRDYELVQTHWDAGSSQLRRFASFFGWRRAVTCLPRFNLSVPYTADSEYGGCRHCIVSLRRNNDTARVLHVRLCSLSRPTLERLSWQRRWTSLCAAVRVLGCVTSQKRRQHPPLRGYVLFGLDLGYIRQTVIFFLWFAFRVSRINLSSAGIACCLLLFPTFMSLRLVKHYDYSTVCILILTHNLFM